MLLLFSLGLLGQLALAWALARSAANLPDPPAEAPGTGPLVRVVVPVAGDDPRIAQCLESIAEQTYAPLETVVLAEQPTARLAAIISDAAESIPVRAAQAITTEGAGWLLFLDPGITLDPDAVRRAVAAAAGADLWSAIPAVELRTLPQLLAQPALLQLAFALLQADAIADPARETAAAFGPMLLVRADAWPEQGRRAEAPPEGPLAIELPQRLKGAGKRLALSCGAQLASLTPPLRGWRQSIRAVLPSPWAALLAAPVVALVIGAPIGSFLALAAAIYAGVVPGAAGPLFWMAVGHALLGAWIRRTVTRGFSVSTWPLVLQPAGALVAAAMILRAVMPVARSRPS